jgi:hypothetical protein
MRYRLAHKFHKCHCELLCSVCSNFRFTLYSTIIDVNMYFQVCSIPKGHIGLKKNLKAICYVCHACICIVLIPLVYSRIELPEHDGEVP